MSHKRTGRMGVRKYLRESCRHRIECFAAYVEKIPKQCCVGYPNSQRAREGVRCDKHSTSGLEDQQMEGQDQREGDI